MSRLVFFYSFSFLYLHFRTVIRFPRGFSLEQPVSGPTSFVRAFRPAFVVKCWSAPTVYPNRTAVTIAERTVNVARDTHCRSVRVDRERTETIRRSRGSACEGWGREDIYCVCFRTKGAANENPFSPDRARSWSSVCGYGFYVIPARVCT